MTDSPCPWEGPDTRSYPDMNYLLTEGAMSRYVLAAHYVRDCHSVVEIGGFKTPITRFLTRVPAHVLVVDPLIQPYTATTLNGEPCQVEHRAAAFQSESFDVRAGTYGMVLLGASMKHFSDEPTQRRQEWVKLIGLLRNARVAVLEFAVEWGLGRNNVESLVDGASMDLRVQLDIDLSRCPGVETEHAHRRLLVLDGKLAEPSGHG